MRTIVILAALLAVAVWAAPAQAKLVYVKNAGRRRAGRVRGHRPRQGSAPARHRPGADDLARRALGRLRDDPGRGLGDGGRRAAEARGRVAAARDALALDRLAALLARLEQARRDRRRQARARLRHRRRRAARGGRGRDPRLLVLAGLGAHRRRQGAAAASSRRRATSTRARRWVAQARADHRLRARDEPRVGARGDRLRPLQAAQGRRARVQPVGARPGRRRRAAPAHQAQDPAAGERAGAARVLRRRAAAAGRVHRPGHPGRLHGGDAHRQDPRALDGLRARHRRLRPLRGRQADPRALRRPGPAARRTT